MKLKSNRIRSSEELLRIEEEKFPEVVGSMRFLSMSKETKKRLTKKNNSI